jgi:hypothetical protein
MNSNTSRPIPPTNTGSFVLDLISDMTLFALQMERRIDPWIRPAFDALLRDALQHFFSNLINVRRANDNLGIAEERISPDEEAWCRAIIETFKLQLAGLWKPGGYERGGNTKTHGIVRGEFIVHEGLAENLRHGIFTEPRSFPAWIRFSGPGPYVTPDIDDVGFMSISAKLMGVPGPKLMEEEKFTQDIFGVSPPTFVTQDARSNADLQKWSLKNASLFHFLNFREPHLLDLILQGLWLKTQSSPFEAPYFSQVPYLLGKGQAMQYSFWPKSRIKTPVPRLPLRPPDDYLRQAMVTALHERDVEFEIRVQLQTDAHRMPIENAGVYWSERLSPRIPVATLRIPRQTFTAQAQFDFAKRLSLNPWHCVPEHRPLGNISRVRRVIYDELAQLRHAKNNVPHYEPNGEEVFD